MERNNVSATKSRFQNWLYHALVAVATVIILAVLLASQPWGISPQNVTTEEPQSYRMSYHSITQTAKGETSELTTESEFVAPDRYHVKLIQDGSVTEFIIIGDKQYVKSGDLSKNITFAVARSSSSFLTKEITLKILDGLTDLEELPDENMDGADCFHYRGRVDVERQAEEEKARLDPEQQHYEEMLKSIEQLRSMKAETELWIGKQDYLIRQIKYDWQVPVEDTGHWDTSSVMVRYYDLNEPIAIEPPLDAHGELLPGWDLVASYPPQKQTFSSDVAISIGGEDPAHQQISFSIAITNISEEVAQNVQVTLSTMATNEASGRWKTEAEPATPVDLEPGDSRTYNISWEYDATNTSKEELSRLVDLTTVLAKHSTPEGEEAVQLLFPDAPYPLKAPPPSKAPPERPYSD